MIYELAIGLTFVLAVVSLISILFTDKKLIFAGLAIILLGVFYYTNSTYHMAESWPLIAFVAGVTLLTLEIFIPSFGLIGITGLGLIGLAIYNSIWMDGRELFLLIGASLAIVFSLTVYVLLGFRANIFDRDILRTVNSRDIASKADYSSLLGKKGKTKSILRPTGRIVLDDSYYDARSQGDFIENDKDIVVVSVKDGHIVVKEL
ncbi:NfeD family protein [Anaerococcus tetradius]|uniref:NfeD family protein n=1 Tax=Anaerococcus tetradius TaxID=33036 RepID=UPI0023F349A6|nr:NfeD family protein [Anaerococcus tetradius]